MKIFIPECGDVCDVTTRIGVILFSYHEGNVEQSHAAAQATRRYVLETTDLAQRLWLQDALRDLFQRIGLCAAELRQGF